MIVCSAWPVKDTEETENLIRSGCSFAASEPDSFYSNHGGRRMLLKSGDRLIGAFQYVMETPGTAVMHLFLNETADETECFHAAAVCANQIIRTLHPHKIVCSEYSDAVKRALSRNLFYPKGKLLQRMVEGWRYQLEDRVFDREGYIINQGRMKAIPFGSFNTRDKGCGWIAAYNLLKMNGKEETMQKSAESLGTHAFLNELLGQEIFSLTNMLRSRGLHVQTTAVSRTLCIADMKRSSSGILLYSHTRGSHYTAYQRVGTDSFHFYNAVYGSTDLVMSGSAFLKKYAFLPVTMLLWVPSDSR